MKLSVDLYRGTLVHSTWDEPLKILKDHLLLVKDGQIESIQSGDKMDDVVLEHGIESENIHILSDSEFLMPGLVDTHIHAPQYVYAGTNLDLPLLEWLNQYTFPVEASFRNPDIARNAYDKVVRRVIHNGTTTACWFATIHLEASLILCDVIERMGQRAYVGKVNMTRNSPAYYCEDTDTSITDTKKFVASVLKRQNPLITPVITPRFAPSCDMSMMTELGKIAKDFDVPVQSHISESRNELKWVAELYPKAANYCDVYDQAGLLTNKTVMAHGIYLSDDELLLLKDSGTSISHCPNSNLSIRSGLCDVRRLLDKGIKVGLGTDVAGGFSPCILDAIRLATQVSNMLYLQQGDDYKVVDYKEAFRLATLGGSAALGLDKVIGNFEVGKQFDALLINHNIDDCPFDVFPRDKTDDIVQKFLYLGDNRNIREVFVAGKKIHSRC